MSLRLRARRDGTVTLEAPPPDRHHFTPRWLTNALAAGHASVRDGRIVVHTGDGDLVYRIMHPPGRAVCCGCEETIDMDGPAATPEGAQLRLSHVMECEAAGHDVDPNNPTGYRVDMFWDTQLEEG